MAQLIVSAAGAAIGFAIAGPTGAQVGWAIGSAVGAQFGPTQRSKGPRLEDLRVSGTEYGQAIPWIDGHPRMAGQIWWASDRREIATTTEAGKGGGGAEYTEYTYEVDLLIGLTDRVIGGVSRVWSNGKLVYTKLSTSDAASALSSKAQASWDVMTVYTGAADQLPDPTYEAAVGVGNAPAYRGRGTVVIQGLQLGNSGQLPNLSFEVYTQGDDVGDTVTTLVEHFEGTSSLGRGAVAFASPSFTFHFGQSTTVTVFQFTLGLEEPEVLRTYSLVTGGFAPYHLNSDVSGQVICNTGSTSMYVYNDEGIGVEYTLPYNINNTAAALVYARRGSDIVVGSDLQSVSNTKRLYRFPTTGGIASVTGAVMALAVRSITIAGSYVYAVNAPGATLTATAVYVLDLATLSLQDTLAVPAAFNNYLYNDIVTDENDNVFLIGSDKVWRLDNGSTWTVVKDYSGGSLVSGQLASRVGIWNGDLYSISYFNPDNRLSVVFEAVDLTEPTIQETVEALCARAGMPAGTYDATALASITKPVRALSVAQVTSVRSVLDQLASAYFFDCYLADKLYFVPRGGAVALSVDNADLGAGPDQPLAESLKVTIASETELPAQLALTYANADGDYTTATEYSDRLLSGVVSTSAVQLPLALTAAEAKGIADAMLQDTYASRISGEVALPQAYSRLVPTDVVTLTADDGTTYRARLVRRTDDGQTIAFEWLLDEAAALVSAGVTSGDYAPSLTVSLPGPTTLALLDIPLLRDADDTPGIYAAVKPVGATSWPGAKLYGSLDGVNYTEAGTVNSRAIIGETTVALTSYTGGNVFDTAGSVTVDVGAATLASATRDALLNSDANAMLVGAEVIQYTTATYVSDGVYKLTGLLRGRRGTEWAMTGHAIGETVVQLRTAGLLPINYEAARIGVAQQFKAVTLGKTLASATARSITDTGVRLKPWAVQNIRAVVLNGRLTLTWDRRTRLSHRWPSATTIVLGELTESYAVELYDDVADLVSTQTVSTNSAVFEGATQVSDWAPLSLGFLVEAGSDLYGVHANAGQNRYLVRVDDATGAAVETGAVVGQVARRMVLGGGYLYVLADTQDLVTGVTTATTVQRFDPADLSVATHTYTGATAGDIKDICHDGTALWAVGYTSGNLYELDPADLTLSSTTFLELYLYQVVSDGSWLYIHNRNADVFAYEPGGGPAEKWRRNPGSGAGVVHERDGLVYVTGFNTVLVLDATDGAILQTHATVAEVYATAPAFVDFGAYVAFLSNEVAWFLDASDGALAFTATLTGSSYLAGAQGGTLYALAPDGSGQAGRFVTVGYQLVPDLTGYTATVYQVSATVGRGYPASITL